MVSFPLLVLLLISVVVIGKSMLSNYNNLDKMVFLTSSKNYMSSNDTNNENIGSNEVEQIKLYRNNNVYNEKFNVENMFPGDSETKYYCVNVSYKNDITLKYSVDIESDYKKIEDVFNLKVKLLNANKVLYDGPIKNIKETIDYSTSSSKSITEEFCYEITAYLDTSVGNEYQNKETFIDFEWLVDNDNLENEKNPQTGDNIEFWIGLVLVSVILLLFVLLILKNERKRSK